MRLIVAVDKNWAIGNKNQLLVRIPQDQKFFRNTTTNQVVIMGRKTLESFPGGQPLPNRVNIVITNREDYQVKDAIVVHSPEEAVAVAKTYEGKEIYVIGGSTIYEQLLPECEEAYVTYVDQEYAADAYFPEHLDDSKEWVLTQESEEQTYFDLEYYFQTYKRI
jgi:dihydrofolate reductase